MKDVGVIHGSAAQAVPLVVGIDVVYVHTDIVQIPMDQDGNVTDNLFQYHEIQYSKDEYIKLMDERNLALEDELTNTQLALCDVYELIGG